MLSVGRVVADFQKRRFRRRFERCVGTSECAIPTHMTFHERVELHELARSIPADASAVEVGSYLGASTCFLAAGLRGRVSALTCIDTFMNETMPEGDLDTYAEFRRNTARYEKSIRVIRKRSDEVLAETDLPTTIELLFLDGDHSYETVKKELSFFLPLLRRGAVVAMHDVKYCLDVQRAMAERILSGDLGLSHVVHNLGVLTRI